MDNKKKSFIDVYSQFFLICQDKIMDKGEDSYVYNFNKNAGLIGVFDGCGGSGGRRYEEFGNKTGAYLASRVVSEKLNNWFNCWSEGEILVFKQESFAEEIKKEIDNGLQEYICNVKRKNTLKGSIQKDFPTTVAMCVFRYNSLQSQICVNVLWSGDSRAYWLDDKGLHQLTKDDVEGEDAMSNIYSDGVLTNVISASEPYVLREYSIQSLGKGIAFVSSDGCFGYLPSPMHFEYLILNSMLKADTLEEWEEELRSNIVEYTGDDATMCGVLLNFETFTEVKNYYKNRQQIIKQEYIDSFCYATSEQKQRMWEKYQTEYKSVLEANIE